MNKPISDFVINAPRPSLRKAVDLMCRACVYDPFSTGNWREQVACCSSPNCPLFESRPVPDSCMFNGIIDREAVAAVRRKIKG